MLNQGDFMVDMKYVSIKLLHKKSICPWILRAVTLDTCFKTVSCSVLILLSYFNFNKVIITTADWLQQYYEELKGELKGIKSLHSCLGHRRADSLHHLLCRVMLAGRKHREQQSWSKCSNQRKIITSGWSWNNRSVWPALPYISWETPKILIWITKKG